MKKMKEASVREKACLYEWTIKTCAYVTRPFDIGMAILVVFPIWSLAYGFFFGQDEESSDIFIMGGIIGLMSCAYIWKTGVRQKTLYAYCITKQEGLVTYQLYYPKWAGNLFKSLAIAGSLMVITMVVIMPGSIAMAAGAGGMTIAAVITLVNWQPPPIKIHKVEWVFYDLVFIDRKRKMVVTSYQHDQLVGFEAHLKKEQIDEFVNFLKTVIPSAEFREAPWKW